MLSQKRILLIISGGIAAYKSLDLIRRLREQGAMVNVILTKAAEEFLTPLSVSALAGNEAYRGLFDLTREAQMGHIELSRAADLVVVAPATADLMAKLASGFANDLASTALLATDKKVLLAPAMNVRMWHHASTQRNLAQLKEDGHLFIGPNEGDMACGEFGLGRMAEVPEILAAIGAALETELEIVPALHAKSETLAGHHIIVTSGPTHEPIDPVRYISNRSSGKQGHAIAAAAAAAGARVTLISGPVHIPPPAGIEVMKVKTARDMLRAVEKALPADVFIGCAAVADWRLASIADSKIKKVSGSRGPTLALMENPDILTAVAKAKPRPKLVIGFAAETENLLEKAKAKRARKSCDWIVANDVSEGADVFGSDENEVTLISSKGSEAWPRASKGKIAEKLIARIANSVAAPI